MSMQSKNKNKIKSELIMFFSLTLSAAIIAFNLKSFVRTGDLFPSGFSGLTLLIQGAFEKYANITLPFSLLYIPFNLVPAYIGFKFIGKRFTLYSFYLVFLSSILTDIIPPFPITSDVLLISVFGGIINGIAVAISLIAGASAGGVDFISIYFSEKKGVDAWNYILLGNIVILGIAGIMFGFDKSLYSIIFQFTSTQIIQTMFKRYQKDTLLIITSQPMAVYGKIRELTNHDATLIRGEGCYEGVPRNILYSVIGREQVSKVINAIKEIDEHAFINVINTNQINGRFYKRPY